MESTNLNTSNEAVKLAEDVHSNANEVRDEQIRKLKKAVVLLKGKWEQERMQRLKLYQAYKTIYGKYKTEEHLKGSLKQEKEMHGDVQKAFKELKDTQAKLIHSEKMSSLGKLTAGIAHEINNPVNFVANGVNSLRENITQLNSFIDNYKNIAQLKTIEQIQKYCAVLSEDEQYLTDIRESIKELLDDADYGTTRITEIVKGLRSFSRQDESEFVEVNINDLLNGALTILKPKYKKKATIVKELDENIPAIKCFSGQLNQVMVNLIGNAADAIEEQGVITITTQVDGKDKIQIIIKDTGKGMTKEVQNKIFDPFFTTKKIGEGTGLGLSITYGIIEKHQGNITIDSTPGLGTAFTITLPKVIKMITSNKSEGAVENTGDIWN